MQMYVPLLFRNDSNRSQGNLEEYTLIKIDVYIQFKDIVSGPVKV
jgi:hypothetical protein